MIEFRNITWDNYDECIGLEVVDEQKDFVASNMYSIVQSYVALLNEDIPNMTYAIYYNDTMVGFIMMEYDKEEEQCYSVNGHYEDCYAVCRLMIDKRYQGRGYGRQAMVKALEYIKTFPEGIASAIYLSYDPDNVVARRLYTSLGFVETGEINDGELIARLAL